MNCLALPQRGPRRQTLRLLILIAAVSLLAGCTVARMAAGKKGADTSRIEAGILATEIEAALGAPIREWRTPSGILFRVYEYDAGCKPAPGDALAMLFMDIASAGLWEAFMYDLECDHTFHRVVISYDTEGRMLGAFREFDPLPPDGRAEKARTLEEIAQPDKP